MAKVIIDAGHGGKEPGRSTVTGRKKMIRCGLRWQSVKF